MLRKTPGFTLVAIAALAVGIGANITIFGFASALLLKPLPDAEPDRVVRAYSGTESNVMYPHYLIYRDHNRSLAHLAEQGRAEISMRIDGAPEHVSGFAVTGNYFETVGVRAAFGRTITPGDDHRSAAGVLVLSHEFWQQRFRGDPETLGREVYVNEAPYTIAGVMPPDFTGTMAPLTAPFYVAWNAPHIRTPGSGQLIGRLRPGVSVSAAADSSGRGISVSNNRIAPGLFRTLGIGLLQGRDFSFQDRSGTSAVGIVNETLARLMWPDESPIGRRLHSGDDQMIEVVGVAQDSRYQWIGEDQTAFLYRPILQQYTRAGSLLVRTTDEPLSVLPLIRSEVAALDPNLPVYNVNTLENATGISLMPVRIAAALAGVLGMVALALGAIGIYGVMSCVVRQRTREIGIRMALGADAWSVIRLMTRQAISWAATGLGLGLLAALALTRLITGLLYGVAAADPLAFLVVSVILAGTAVIACYIPARHASRIDPLEALREQ